MNHIFVINDMEFENIKLNAEDIIKILFKRNIWVFMNDRVQKRLNPNDKVVVYVAGKGRKYFAADFVIKDRIKEGGYVSLWEIGAI